jgi:hypothetical protein
MKVKKIICWVTKTHKKLVEKTISKEAIFVDSIDDIEQGKNDTVIISTSKITSMSIAEKITKLKDPYFLEKKGIWTHKMMFAMEDSKHHFMIAHYDMDYILKSMN